MAENQDLQPVSRRDFWQGKRCLVTGGSGFGGSHLTEQLLLRGAKVYIIDRVRPMNSYLLLAGLSDKITFVQGDVRDLDLIKFILERYEINTVFHLAAQPIVPMSVALPYDTLSINAMGTYAVLEAVRTSTFAKSLVVASSGAYYGTTMQETPIDEEQAPAKAGNMYVPSKVAADIAVRCYAQAYGMKAACCRFLNTYGPGNINFSTIVPKTITTLIEGRPFDFGARDDGTSTFDYLHIRDMTRGYLTVAENIDRAAGEAFNFSGGRPISVNDLVELISRLYDGKERVGVFHGAPRPIRICKILDTTRAQKILGWTPSITLEDGLKETITWYKEFWPKIQAFS